MSITSFVLKKLVIEATFCFLLLFCGCGKSGIPEFPAPSFVETSAWLAGPPVAAELVGAYVHSFRVRFSGCSAASDNRIVTITPTSKAHVENLTQGSVGCVGELLDFVYGPADSPNTYATADASVAGAPVGTIKKFIADIRKDVVVVTSESVLSASLLHQEKLNFSLMPEKGENLLPAYVTQFAFAGNSDLPNVTISQLADGGVIGTTEHALLLIVECLEPRALSICGAQDLLNLRFWSGVAPATDPVLSNATTLALDPVTLIIPHDIELWRNGFRFNVALPKNGDGSFARRMAFLVRNGDSFRYFVLQMDNILPTLWR